MSETLVVNPYPQAGTTLPADRQAWGKFKLRLEKLIVAVIATLTALVIGALKFHNVHFMWYSPFYQIYSLIAGTFVLSRIVLSCFYREPADEGHLPTISLIIAVKNEEAHIAE